MPTVMKNPSTVRSSKPLAAGVGLLGLVAVGLGLGCGPGLLLTRELTSVESQVRIIEQGQTPPCTLYEERGSIEAESSSPAGAAAAYESTLNRLRRIAAERGASAVMILIHTKRDKVDYAKGVAIRCLPRPEVPAPATTSPAAPPATTTPGAPTTTTPSTSTAPPTTTTPAPTTTPTAPPTTTGTTVPATSPAP